MSIKGFSVGGSVERYDYNFLDNRPNEITVDTALSDSSTNPVQNRVVTSAINSANGSISSISGEVDDLKSAVNQAANVILKVLNSIAYTKQNATELIDEYASTLLPSGYTKYDYVRILEGWYDTAVVDTGLSGEYNAVRYSTRIKFAYNDTLESYSSAIYGLRGGTGAAGLASGRVLWLVGSNPDSIVGYNYNGGDISPRLPLANNASTEIIAENKMIVQDGEVKFADVEGTFDPYTGGTIRLFGCQTASNIEPSKYIVKLYAFEVIDTLTGNYVSKLIPCQRTLDSVAGFYDIIRGVFLHAPTKWRLIAGND